MKVKNKDDSLEMPEECDNCSEETTELERFYYYDQGHYVEWLCCYCCRDFTHGQDDIIKTVASMLHELERRIKKGEPK